MDGLCISVMMMKATKDAWTSFYDGDRMAKRTVIHNTHRQGAPKKCKRPRWKTRAFHLHPVE